MESEREKFLKNFFNLMETREIIYTEDEKNNFQILYNALEDRNMEKVHVINIPMAKGKSTFIKEYCKHKLETDPNFAVIIVNAKIDDCINTCIDLGVKTEYQEEYKDYSIEELKGVYLGKLQAKKKTQMEYTTLPNLNIFNAIAVMGFNDEYCLKYNRNSTYYKHLREDKEKIEQDVKDYKLIVTPPREYDTSICRFCKEKCMVQRAKAEAEKHRIIAISHNRLLGANDLQILIKEFLQCNNGLQRALLIIDEKLEMVDIKTVTLKDVLKLQEYIQDNGTKEDIKLMKSFEKKLSKLKYATSNRDIQENSIKGKFSGKFSEELEMKVARKKKLYEALVFLNNLYRCETVLTSQIYRLKDKREVLTIFRYVDLLEHKKNFENVVLLDATADIDIDYTKSSIEMSNEIVRKQEKTNLFIPTISCNLSKSTIQNHIQNRDSKIVDGIGKECTKIIENTGLDTLIVVYKTVPPNETDFKELVNEKISVDEKEYMIIHFGQFTRGENSLSKYENLVFIGQLRKPPVYYRAKSLAISSKDKIYSEDEVKRNEVLTDTIQQIGRTNFRNGKIPNVYIFDDETIISPLVSGLKEFFDVTENEYNNEDLVNEKKPYTNEKRDIGSHYNKFLEYIYYYIETDSEYKGACEDQYKFKVEDVKAKINYPSSNSSFRQRIVDKVKKEAPAGFIEYKKREVIINLDKL